MPSERDRRFDLGFDAGWKQALDHVASVQRERENGAASLGL